MKKRILIVGGTGLIGRKMAEMFSALESNHTLYIGSRKSNPNDPSVLVVDVNKIETLKAITQHKIDVVVMSVSDKNDNVLRFCIQHNIDYMDIAKPTPELQKAHLLASKSPVNSQIVFSSGWLAGIVGSLAAYLEPNFKKIEAAQLFVYYSMQEAGGESSTHFIAENVAVPFDKYENDKPVPTKHFLSPIKNHFEFGIGSKTVYDLDMPDLFILHEIEGIKTVEVKTAFNSAMTTKVLYWFQKMGIWKRLSLKTRTEAFKSRGKGDKIVFEIGVKTAQKAQKISVIDHDGQSHLTPFSAILTLQQMLHSPQKGVFFSHQLHEPKAFYNQLLSSKKIEIKVQ